MNHHDNNGVSATPALSGINQQFSFAPAAVNSAPAVDNAPAVDFAPAVDNAPAVDPTLTVDNAPAAHIVHAALRAQAASFAPDAATVIALVNRDVASPAGFINRKMREIAADHADRVMVRVEKQGNDLRRDAVALQRQIDKKPSKKEVENVAARVKQANEAIEELRKKLEGARFDDDRMDESGSDAVKIPVYVLEQIQDLVIDNKRLAAKVDQLDVSLAEERRSRKAQARGLMTRIESVEGKIVVDRRARKKLEATVGRVEEKLATEMDRVDEELEHFDRDQTHTRNMIRELQQQVYQLRQTVGGGVLYN